MEIDAPHRDRTLVFRARRRGADHQGSVPEARDAMSDRLTPALRTQIKERGEDPAVGAILITGARTPSAAAAM